MRFAITAIGFCAALLPWLAPATAQDQSRDTVLVHEEEESARIFRELLEDEAKALSLQDTDDYSVVKLVDVLMVVRITSLLELSDEESIRLFQCMHQTLDEIHRLKWERGAIHFYLREDIEADESPSIIQRKLDRALKIEERLAKLTEQWVNDVQAELSVKQRAQLFLFGFDFEDEIRQLIDQAENIAVERHGPISGKYRDHGRKGPRDEASIPEGDGE